MYPSGPPYQQLVRVPAQGVRLLAARHVVPQLPAQQRSSAPGRIHMQPQPMLPAHLLTGSYR